MKERLSELYPPITDFGPLDSYGDEYEQASENLGDASSENEPVIPELEMRASTELPSWAQGKDTVIKFVNF